MCQTILVSTLCLFVVAVAGEQKSVGKIKKLIRSKRQATFSANGDVQVSTAAVDSDTQATSGIGGKELLTRSIRRASFDAHGDAHFNANAGSGGCASNADCEGKKGKMCCEKFKPQKNKFITWCHKKCKNSWKPVGSSTEEPEEAKDTEEADDDGAKDDGSKDDEIADAIEEAAEAAKQASNAATAAQSAAKMAVDAADKIVKASAVGAGVAEPDEDDPTESEDDGVVGGGDDEDDSAEPDEDKSGKSGKGPPVPAPADEPCDTKRIYVSDHAIRNKGTQILGGWCQTFSYCQQTCRDRKMDEMNWRSTQGYCTCHSSSDSKKTSVPGRKDYGPEPYVSGPLGCSKPDDSLYADSLVRKSVWEISGKRTYHCPKVFGEDSGMSGEGGRCNTYQEFQKDTTTGEPFLWERYASCNLDMCRQKCHDCKDAEQCGFECTDFAWSGNVCTVSKGGVLLTTTSPYVSGPPSCKEPSHHGDEFSFKPSKGKYYEQKVKELGDCYHLRSHRS